MGSDLENAEGVLFFVEGYCSRESKLESIVGALHQARLDTLRNLTVYFAECLSAARRNDDPTKISGYETSIEVVAEYIAELKKGAQA